MSFSVSPSSRRLTGIPVQRRDDRGDVVLVDLLLHHRLELLLLALGQLGLERGQLAVADLGHALQVAGALDALGLHPQVVDPLRDLLDAVELLLLLRPARGQLVAVRLRVGELALDRRAHVARLLAHGGELDLELAHPSFRLVQRKRGRVDLHPQARGGLVHEVDGLVRQIAVGDVAVGEDRGGDQRGVPDADAVMRLVALLQAAEDGDRVRDGGLPDEHRLEATLERGVLLDVLPVLVQCRRADRAELAAREHRLQHVGRVDGALRGTGADDRVQLVDEEDDLALRLLDLGQDGLEPLLELTAVLRAGEERPDVERPDPLALQALGNVAGDDALGEALRDRGLPHAGVADEHRVVLRSAREHLDHAPDLFVAPDDRVELPLLGELREVAPELLQRLVGTFRILRGDPLRAADLPQGVEERVPRNDVEREEEMLGRDELVLELPHLLLGVIEHLGERGRDARLLSGCALDGRLCGEHRLGAGAHVGDRGSGTLDERPRELLVQEREHEVLRIDLGVAAPAGQLLGGADSFLRLDGQPVEVHVLVMGRGSLSSGSVYSTSSRRYCRWTRCTSLRMSVSSRASRACSRPSSSWRRSTVSTPARLSPSSVVRRWMSRSRSRSASE